ncbi:hypothetical protein BpHYR1_026252 [Brachionus plicatilis]|uniref:Uncharacterized protein n=1 Tax=Brachionus plicatilis TaxID=10195 RepID=A0A3M7P4X7_BRAPC|nr:hypothetical protein BpHYR1_026252 [Brachionus plicatilis]
MSFFMNLSKNFFFLGSWDGITFVLPENMLLIIFDHENVIINSNCRYRINVLKKIMQQSVTYFVAPFLSKI